jgi:putative DNA primase/helicase
MKQQRQNPSEVVILSPGTPAISAAKFKAKLFPTLILYQNEFMSWDGAAYQAIETQTISSSVSAFMDGAKVAGEEIVRDETGKKLKSPILLPFNPKPKDVADVYTMLKHSCHVPIGTMDPPAWLKGAPKEYAGLDPRNMISLQNGLLDIDTRILHPATPYFFTRTALAMKYDPAAPVPEGWLKFLQQVTKSRQPLIDLIQEMLGYLLTCDTSMQKIFFLWGRTRSGKGTVLRITTALVGKNNTRFPSIETLAGRFGIHNLIGASVAQVTDANTMNPAHLGTSASRMNGISGEDGQTVERKGVGDWNGKISARFQIAGNALPNFGTNTGAMATRLLIIPFEVSFEHCADRRLTEKLIAELPGIFNWSLAGLDMLRLMGDFTEPAVSRAAKKRLVHLSDPIHGFVEDCCIVQGGAAVDKAALYPAYVDYCEEARARPQSLGKFTEGLQAIHSSVTASRRRNGTAPQVQCFRNIRLNDEMACKVYQCERDDSDDLGLGPLVIFKRDAGGSPILRNGRANDFEP